ncbi:hypothetical protein TrispH2_008615 [Trichoplax sp. H2]|nr:hypothetical protein TrispH2_008615 [Trichoplax sp. H2]|eukprot:RDD38987.1 hypothetical protein TrispH2_008615 [Trichoplax sp. H2]
MEKHEEDAIKECWSELVKSMPVDHMKNKLFSKRILEISDLEAIDAMNTINKKNQEILKLVTRSQSPETYNIFITALREIPTRNNILADMVEKCNKKSVSYNSSSNTASANINADQTDSVGVDKSSACGEKWDVFLSYSWNNKDEVKKIKSYLEQQKWKVWIDDNRVAGGQDLDSVLSNGIEACKVFVPCLNRSYANSDNCYSELSHAKDLKKFIIPIVLGDVDPKNGGLKGKNGDLNFKITGLTYIKIKDFEDKATTNIKLNDLNKAVQERLIG